MHRPKTWAVFLIALAGILGGILTGAFFSLGHDLPQINALKQFKPSAASVIYSSDNRIITKLYLEKRFPVNITQVPPILIDAVLATEDRRFFSHRGMDLKSLFRAVISDIKAGRFKQGGSTLTQQLAKTLFLTPEKSIIRKIKEALLTFQIERRYTKNEILELYLNLIYFGSGSYGIQAASNTYFGKDINDITLAEAALLAGLPKAPSRYSPLRNPERATARRDLVLSGMLTTGKITAEQYHEAAATPYIKPPETEYDNAPYFTAFIKQALLEHVHSDLIYTKGLRVYTTLDLSLQEAGRQAVARQMDRLGERLKNLDQPDSPPQAALISLDADSGQIISMIGGRDFVKSPFNRALHAKRQPGSAFKPIVFAAAIEAGINQNRTILDAPLSFHIPGTSQEWVVENFSRTFSGEMTLRKALALSKNTPAVRLIDKISPTAVVDFARGLGIDSLLRPNLSLALGTSEVSLLELSRAYCVFANGGVKVSPYGIERVVDHSGTVLFQSAPDREAVMSSKHAAIITDMLKGVILEGTGRKAKIITKEVAGKTGTTDHYKDALFIGFSRDIVTGVWVGRDDSTSLGKGETGAKAALPIWIDYMQAALDKKPYQFFDIPDGLKVIYMDPVTGKGLPGSHPKAIKAITAAKDTP